MSKDDNVTAAIGGAYLLAAVLTYGAFVGPKLGNGNGDIDDFLCRINGVVVGVFWPFYWTARGAESLFTPGEKPKGVER